MLNPSDMSNFPDVMNRILGVVFIVIVFAIAYAYLKPHRLHKRRPVSTLLLKGSYLLYLIILLLIVFMASFYKGGLDEVFLDIESFAFLVVLFGPTIGIFARKLGHFREKRDNFNYFFLVINLLSITALVLMYIY